jgi:hypothetical protein
VPRPLAFVLAAVFAGATASAESLAPPGPCAEPLEAARAPVAEGQPDRSDGAGAGREARTADGGALPLQGTVAAGSPGVAAATPPATTGGPGTPSQPGTGVPGKTPGSAPGTPGGTTTATRPGTVPGVPSGSPGSAPGSPSAPGGGAAPPSSPATVVGLPSGTPGGVPGTPGGSPAAVPGSPSSPGGGATTPGRTGPAAGLPGGTPGALPGTAGAGSTSSLLPQRIPGNTARVHFLPGNVAAPPPSFAASRPTAPRFAGPNSCDTPGSGCLGPIQPAPVVGGGPSGAGGIRESPAGPGLPPGTRP